MQRLLLALLGKRRSALWSCMDVGAELLLLFCCHRTRTYLRMESSLREVEPGDEVQELRTREPFCTPGQLLSGATWRPGFFNYWGNKLCVYIRIFTTESVLNEIVPFIAQLSHESFSFFLAASKTSHPLDPAKALASSSRKQALLSWARRTLSLLWIPRTFYKLIFNDTSPTLLYSFFLRYLSLSPCRLWATWRQRSCGHHLFYLTEHTTRGSGQSGVSSYISWMNRWISKMNSVSEWAVNCGKKPALLPGRKRPDWC